MNTAWEKLAQSQPWIQKEYDALSEEARHDAFYESLAFGTAGMRGLLGIGPNRMNQYTVAKANYGYGKYLKETFKHQNISVAIAYDNRHQSLEFAKVSAQVLRQFGIRSYIFKHPRPTPELSFAVRELGCQGGIVITASHNPKEYNGYKIYDETGCQLVDDKIARVIKKIKEHEDETTVPIPEIDDSHLIWLDESFDAVYEARLLGILMRPEAEKTLKIVFSSQHGTSYPLVPRLLQRIGYDVTVVDEQKSYDPDFSNTLTPNPEDHDSFRLALEYAKRTDADLVLSCDPDADRLGVVVKHEGTYHYLTGNQGGSILQEYLYRTRIEQRTMPEHPMMFNTIVTSDLGEKIARSYGVAVEKTLTGFKYIGEKIEQHNQKGDADFVFGYEESYGYLLADFVRDKDALQACLMIAEAANYYQSKGKTFVDVLEALYAKHGYYFETQVALTLKGEEGLAQIQKILETFRAGGFETLGNQRIVNAEDYLASSDRNGSVLDFPKSNVLKYFLEDGSWIAVRPSGTEPKCKFYYCIVGRDFSETQAKFNDFHFSVKQIAGI